MNQLIPFQFHTHTVRVIPHENGYSFWVVGKDVADALNYATAKDALRQVPEKHKGRQKVPTVGRGVQEMLCVDEAGLYRLVLRSNKPEAEPFMEWVTADVLPSIRKTGGYTAPPAVRPGQVEALRLDLAQENGDLRDALREQAALIDDLKDELLDVYRSRSPVRKVREKIVYKVPTAALELMVEYRIPRDRIAAVSGLTRLCLRQHIHNAREAGRLQ